MRSVRPRAPGRPVVYRRLGLSRPTARLGNGPTRTARLEILSRSRGTSASRPDAARPGFGLPSLGLPGLGRPRGRRRLGGTGRGSRIGPGPGGVIGRSRRRWRNEPASRSGRASRNGRSSWSWRSSWRRRCSPSWRRGWHRSPGSANGSGRASGPASPGIGLSRSGVSPGQPSCAAARIGCGVTPGAYCGIAIFRRGWRGFLRLLGGPGLAQVANPVVVGIGFVAARGTAARARLATAQSATLLRWPRGTNRQRSARVLAAEPVVKEVGSTTVCRTTGARVGVFRVGPPQIVLVPRPSRRHYVCYS